MGEKLASTTKQPFIKARHVMVLGTFLISILLYVDRACISAAKDPIQGDLNLSDTQIGWVLSIFTLGYALFQTPSGIMADKFGPRTVLTAIMFAWSLFTALTGWAFNFVYILVVRFLFGGAEAGAFPGMARAVYSWIPLKERGLVQGINFSGSRLGAAFALPLVAWLIEQMGWRHTFLLLGGAGILFAIIWYITFRDDPMGHGGVSEAEKEYIRENRQQPDPGEADIPALTGETLFGSRNMWLAMAQYFCSNFTFFFTLTWLFPHIKATYNLDQLEAGFYASAPLFAGAAGNWFSGWLVDRIYSKGSWRMSRALPAIIGFSLAAVGLVGSVFMDDINGAIAFLCIAIFGADMTLSPSWAFCIDIGRKNAGAVSGTMNMAGNIGSFCTSLAFPYLKAWTGSVTPFFFLGAILNLVAIALWLFMKPDQPIQSNPTTGEKAKGGDS